MFPETPQTLLKKIAALADGDDSAEWEAFVELYTPPLKNFIRAIGGGLSPDAVEDAVQDVFIRLVDVLRGGRVDRRKGRFRAYLASMTRRLLIDRYRESLARPALGRECDTEAATSTSSAGTIAFADPGMLFDARWRLAVRAAAVDHLMTKTAVSEQSKQIYHSLQSMPPKDVAAQYGISYDAVKQVKSRLDRAVAAVERQMLK